MRCLRLAVVLLAGGVLLTPAVRAALFANVADNGTLVNGYQDEFDGLTLNPAWLEYDGGVDDPPLFVLTGAGTLQMNPANNDPNKLLYNPGTAYSATDQEVLALIRVTTAGSGDAFRGGLTAGSNTGDGRGICLHFRGPGAGGNGDHFNLLDDGLAWGPATDPTLGGEDWNVGEWKWLRLQFNSSGSTINARVWDAGSTPEPTDWDITWSGRSRSGLAGLVTNSIGGTGVFEVDYILIKAGGLPAITVNVPEPAAVGLLLVAAGVLAGRGRRDRQAGG